MEIVGSVAFVTGGARGIGRGIALALAAEGASVAVADIDGDALAQTADELASLTTVYALALDLRDRARLAQVAEDVLAELGPVSILCNNAGVAGGAEVVQMTYEQWDFVIDINLGGVVNGIQTFLPHMLGRPGHIVNTSSGSGLAVIGSGAGCAYHSTKYAVVGLSEAMRVELEPYGIGVSVLCPGPVATDILASTKAIEPAGTPVPTRHGQPLNIEQSRQTLARYGRPPEEVGELVAKGIRDNALYLHTDGIMSDAIRKRTQALLAAMPSSSPP